MPTDHLQAGSADPVAWANDSLQLARQAWVQPQTNIDQAYYQRERPVVDRQLALAGLRLAQILNEELGRCEGDLEEEAEHIEHFVADFNVA